MQHGAQSPKISDVNQSEALILFVILSYRQVPSNSESNSEGMTGNQKVHAHRVEIPAETPAIWITNLGVCFG